MYAMGDKIIRKEFNDGKGKHVRIIKLSSIMKKFDEATRIRARSVHVETLHYNNNYDVDAVVLSSDGITRYHPFVEFNTGRKPIFAKCECRAKTRYCKHILAVITKVFEKI